MSQHAARHERSVTGLVAAMVVLVVVVLAWVAFRSLVSTDPTTAVRTVDYARIVPVARKAAPFDLVAPVSLPAGWRATTVRYTPAPGSHWHLGALTGEGRYVGLEQGDLTVRSMVQEYVDEAATRGAPVDVRGVRWSTYTDSGGDLGLVRRSGTTTTLVVGHDVPRSTLVAYVAGLR